MTLPPQPKCPTGKLCIYVDGKAGGGGKCDIQGRLQFPIHLCGPGSGSAHC